MLTDILQNIVRPLSGRSLAELVSLSAICHLLAFLVINFAAWFFPNPLPPPSTSVEIVTERQLQQRLAQSKTPPKKELKLESAKPAEKKEEEKKEEIPKESPTETPKETPKESPTETPKESAKKTPKESVKKEPASKVEQPKQTDTSDPIEDILSSLEEDANNEEQGSESSFDESLEEALSDDAAAAPFLSSEQILTASELAAFRKHIFGCWSPPIGAPSLENLVVDLDLTLDQNAYVIEVRVIDKSRMSRDPFFRSAAEAALRTLSNSACSPLKLPLHKHSLWQRTILRFDPRHLFGL